MTAVAARPLTVREPRLCSACTRWWWPQRPTHRNRRWDSVALTFVRRAGSREVWFCPTCGVDYLFGVAS